MQAECVCRRSPYMCALGALCVSNVNAAVSECSRECACRAVFDVGHARAVYATYPVKARAVYASYPVKEHKQPLPPHAANTPHLARPKLVWTILEICPSWRS